MFTRCPKCKEVHPLTAAVLSRSTGLVQCGRCDRIFNALSFLSDDWHASQTFKPAEKPDGELPVLGARKKRPVRKAAPAVPAETPDALNAKAEIEKPAVEKPGVEKAELEKAEEVETAQASSSAPSVDSPPADVEPEVDLTTAPAKAGKAQNRLWGLGVALLVLFTVANTGWTFRDSLMQQPWVHQWMLDRGWVELEKAVGILTSPADIQLVSRDMHTHPTRTGILVLSVTFVNLAQQTQAFPVLRITLLDGGNQTIAQRRLQPAEYLRAGANISSGLAPDVFLPVLLELADPGEQAVGFEIEFL